MKGVIAAGDPETVAAGAKILRQGGNAVDAAVAAAFVSFIAEIGVVHLGGSGVAQVFKPNHGENKFNATTYDFFSCMPGLGLDPAGVALDFEKVTINFGPTTQDFFLGRGSVAVPGNIFGLCQLAADFGCLPLPDLLEPAIRLAQSGHSIAQFQADTCALLEPIYTHTAEMRSIFAQNGHIIQAQDWFLIPDLARSLQELATLGPQFARTGSLAQALLADQAAHGGLLTPRDLAEYKVLINESIRLPYRDYEILLPPPSSSGGVLTAFSLSLLSTFDLSSIQHGSTSQLRLLYEIMAATTRARPIWDKAIDELPTEDAVSYFLDERFLRHYASEVRDCLAGESTLPTLSEPSFHPDTSHLSVIDESGLAVSLTTTAGESAGYIVPGTGYIPNNILGEADLHPAGFHTRPPGQRIPTMMTPTIVLYNGQIRLVLGSGGSIRIRSAILQVLSNLLDFKMPLSEAVNAPRVHLEDGLFQCEFGVSQQTMAELEKLGYKVNRWDRRSIYFGGAHSVSRTLTGQLVAAGDNRRGGAIEIVA